MSLAPSLASARSRVRLPPNYAVGAAIDPRDNTLVVVLLNADTYTIEVPIRVHSDTTQYDWLFVEFSNENTKRGFMFIEDREHAATETVRIAPKESVTERIPLAERMQELPPGEYHVRVVWDGHEATTTATVSPTPMICAAPPDEPRVTPSPSRSPSKLPYLLGSFAILSLLVAARFGKRAGTPDGCVPCSLP